MAVEIQNTIISTVAGVVLFIAGVVSQRTLEISRWKQVRKDEIEREKRGLTGDLSGSLAEFIHTMLWFSYFVPDSGLPADDLVKQYKDESHHLIGRMVGARAKIAAMDYAIYQKLSPLIDEALQISEDIDDASGLVASAPAVDGVKLERLNEKARNLMDKVNKTISNLYLDGRT